MELTPQKRQAYELMLRRFERIGERWHHNTDEQYELLLERKELEDLWRLAGFGDPPEFSPTRPRVAA